MLSFNHKGLHSELSPDGGVVGTTDIGCVTGNGPSGLFLLSEPPLIFDMTANLSPVFLAVVFIGLLRSIDTACDHIHHLY